MAQRKRGERLGRFEILELLGRGGMGEVYLALDTQLGREVALKVLPAEVARDADARARLIREARTAAALNHPRVATLFEAGEADGLIYLVMERVRGRPLRDYLTGALPVPQVRAFAGDLAEALAYAHRQGVIHRDLKPDNVMVGEDGHLKLLDFGLAKLTVPQVATTGATAHTIEGTIQGSLGYMSPEQATGSATDARTDVFAFGVLLYELLSGRRPFSGESVSAAVAAVLRDEPAALTDIPGIPDDLERLWRACLAKDPGARPSDGTALLAALGTASHPSWTPPPTDTLAMNPTVVPRWSGVRHRHRRVFAGVAVVLGLAGASWFALRHRAVGLLDLRLSASARPEATAALRAGLSAARDGASHLALEQLTRAAELDPSLAQAHLQRALAAWWASENEEDSGQVALRAATQLHQRLGARDRALLSVLEPLLDRSPPNGREAEGRVRHALAEFPDDAQLHLIRARLMVQQQPAEAAAEADQALHLDPGYAAALEVEATALALQGSSAAALPILERCLVAAPDSADCLWDRMGIDSWEGRCAAMEEDARAWQALDRSTLSAQYLASAMLAQDKPRAAVELTFSAAFDGGALPPWVRSRLAIYDGRFSEAIPLEENQLLEAEGAPGLEAHSRPTFDLIGLYEEAGMDGRAADVAASYLARKDAWRADGHIAAEWDGEPRALHALVRAGRLSRKVFDEKRRSWLERWVATGTAEAKGDLWLLAFGRTVDTPEEAQEAIGLLDVYGPVPRYRLFGVSFTDVAVVERMAGRNAEALPLLRKAAASCRVTEEPFRILRASYQLGLALEATGDRSEACRAYGRVLVRWGHASPTSVTGEASRARWEALGCGADAGAGR